jgi:diaminohydroxyphosphoribosylaminopyrimidine deaminase/5-amino-6-(5-phosphoribosylamino)uracil reductase
MEVTYTNPAQKPKAVYPGCRLLLYLSSVEHIDYMQRALQLAQLGAGFVSPNPMVGAVLVHEGRVIGEGYHQQFGQAHAEVNCLAAVTEADRALIPASTLYVSLEPCAHHGKTPPCTDLILQAGIRRVVVGSRDPFAAVDGKGTAILRAAGVDVITYVAEADCRALNRHFFTFHQLGRPYIYLKWAETADGFVATADRQAIAISNDYTNRWMHRYRQRVDAILIGTDTAIQDDPRLTIRYGFTGRQPVRVLIDGSLRVPLDRHLYDGSAPTLVIHDTRVAFPPQVQDDLSNRGAFSVRWRSVEDVHDPAQVLACLQEAQIGSVWVEGGPTLQQSWIDAGYWDEALIIRAPLPLGSIGIPAPQLSGASTVRETTITGDQIQFFRQSVP